MQVRVRLKNLCITLRSNKQLRLKLRSMLYGKMNELAKAKHGIDTL